MFSREQELHGVNGSGIRRNDSEIENIDNILR